MSNPFKPETTVDPLHEDVRMYDLDISINKMFNEIVSGFLRYYKHI